MIYCGHTITLTSVDIVTNTATIEILDTNTISYEFAPSYDSLEDHYTGGTEEKLEITTLDDLTVCACADTWNSPSSAEVYLHKVGECPEVSTTPSPTATPVPVAQGEDPVPPPNPEIVPSGVMYSEVCNDCCYDFNDLYFKDSQSGNKVVNYVISGREYLFCSTASGECGGCGTGYNCQWIYLDVTSHKPDGTSPSQRLQYDSAGSEVSSYWIDGNDFQSFTRCLPMTFGTKETRTFELKVCDCGSISCACESEYTKLGTSKLEINVASSDYEPDLFVWTTSLVGSPTKTIQGTIYVTNLKTGSEDNDHDNPALDVTLSWAFHQDSDAVIVGNVLDGRTGEVPFEIDLPAEVGNYPIIINVEYSDASGKRTTLASKRELVLVQACEQPSDCGVDACSETKRSCKDVKTIKITKVCKEYACISNACSVDETTSTEEESCATDNFCLTGGECSPCVSPNELCGTLCKTEEGKCCASKWFSGGECCDDEGCVSLKGPATVVPTGKARCDDKKHLAIGQIRTEYKCLAGRCAPIETEDKKVEECSYDQICSSIGGTPQCTKCMGTFCNGECKSESEKGACCTVEEKEQWFSGENKCCSSGDCDGKKCCNHECMPGDGACCKDESGKDQWYDGEKRCCVKGQCESNEMCSDDNRCIKRKAIGELCDTGTECDTGLTCEKGICCTDGKVCCKEDSNCDDDKKCTTDVCKDHFCVNENLAAGKECGEGMFCDGKGTCENPAAAGKGCAKDVECASEICCEGECREAAAGKCCEGKWHDGGCCVDDDCGEGKKCKDHGCYTPNTCGNGICENTTVEYNECTDKICEKDCKIDYCLNDGVCVEVYGESCKNSPDCECIATLDLGEVEEEYITVNEKIFKVGIENSGNCKSEFIVKATIDGLELENSERKVPLEKGESQVLTFRQTGLNWVPEKQYTISVVAYNAHNKGLLEEERAPISTSMTIREKTLYEKLEENPLFKHFLGAKELIAIVATVISAGLVIIRFTRTMKSKDKSGVGPESPASAEQATPPAPPAPITTPYTPPAQAPQPPTPPSPQWGQTSAQVQIAQPPAWDQGATQSKFCPNCGQQLKAEAHFCEYCGNKLQ